jgi:hypothetical protein
MEIRELLASAAGSGNLNFGRNVLVRNLIKTKLQLPSFLLRPQELVTINKLL